MTPVRIQRQADGTCYLQPAQELPPYPAKLLDTPPQAVIDVADTAAT